MGERKDETNRLMYSFFLLAGRVGTNLSFCVPCRVISDFFARLLIALDEGRLDGASGEFEYRKRIKAFR